MTIDALLDRMADEPKGEADVDAPVERVAEAVFAAFPAGSGVSFGIDGEVDPIHVTWWPAETAG